MHLRSLKLICPMVKEEMHLQENTLYDLDLVVKVTQNVVQCPPNHMTYAPRPVGSNYRLGGHT